MIEAEKPPPFPDHILPPGVAPISPPILTPHPPLDNAAAAAAAAQPDRVVPVPPLDAGQPDRVVYIMMRFDAVLDVARLQGALESLLATTTSTTSGHPHPGWRRLGARLRRGPRDGRLEYHIPAHFSPARPAVAFSHDRRHAGVGLAEHPLGRRLPPGGGGGEGGANADKPHVACNVDDFLDWMRPPGYPERLEEYLGSDAPLLGVHAVSFADATLVTFAWLHTLSDIMGVRELFTAWVAMLEGRPHDVRPVNDVVSDWSLSLASPPPPPTTTASSSSGQLRAGQGEPSPRPLPSDIPISGTAAPDTAAIERRFVCFPAGYMRRLAAAAAADLEEMQQLAEATSGDECGPLWVSSGDLVGALIARICLRHADPPLAPDDAAHILNATSIRQALEDDLIPSGIAHVGNAVTAARAELQASDVATKPLAYAALAVRRALQRTLDRDTLLPLMAALVGRSARVMQNHGGPSGAAAAAAQAQYGKTKKTVPVFITNWSKARLYETDFSAAVVPRGPDSSGQDGGGGGRPSYMLWHSSGGRLRNTAIVVTDPHGAVWWSCQLPSDEWAKLEKNLADGIFDDYQAVAKVE